MGKSDPFVKAYCCWIRDSNLPGHLFKTMTGLLMFCIKDPNSTFVSTERLAAEMDMEPRTIERHLAELQKRGYVRTESRGMGRTSIKIIANTEETYSKRQREKKVNPGGHP